MARQGFEPIGRDRLELRCMFIPDGYNRPRPAPTGFDHLELRCIWVPDGYNGPPLGHPWIEVGRVAFDAEPADADTSSPGRPSEGVADTRQRRGARHDLPMAVPPLTASNADIAPPAADVAEGWTAWDVSSAYSRADAGAVFPSVNAVPHPRDTLAALQAASPDNPIVRSLARDARSGRSHLPATYTQPADDPIQQEPLPDLPPSPSPPSPTIGDTELERGRLLPWEQPDFAPGSLDQIHIPSDTGPSGPVDAPISKAPPLACLPAERRLREASFAPKRAPDVS